MGRHPVSLVAPGPARAADRGVPRPRPVPSLPSAPLPPVGGVPAPGPSARSLLAEAVRDHHRAIERHADAAAVADLADADLAELDRLLGLLGRSD